MRSAIILTVLFVGSAGPAEAYEWEKFRTSDLVENRIKEAERVTPERFDAGVKRLVTGLEFLQKADCTNIKWFKDGDRKPLLKKLKAAKKAVDIFTEGNAFIGNHAGEVNSCQGAFVAQENAICNGQLSIEHKVEMMKLHYAASAKLAEANVKKLHNVEHSEKVVKTPECANLATSLKNALLDFEVDYGHVYETLQTSWKKLNAAADDLLVQHCSSASEGDSPSATDAAPISIKVGSKQSAPKAAPVSEPSKPIAVEPELQDFVSGALGPGKLDRP